MSDIMCHWLNEELKLSKSVDQKTLAKDFASGFLIGEVLHKYQLQDDFDQFSQSRATNSKLNNFSRMEPTLNLLGVQFDQNAAQAIMSEQHGAATRLLYQLYIVLQKKKKAGLTGVVLETMRPAAPAKLQGIQTEIYRERLKNILPRQTDLNLQSVTDQFEQRSKEIDEKMIRLHNEELRKAKQIQEELKYQDIDKLRQASRKRNEIMARIQAAIVQIPKLPANRTLKTIESQKNMKKKKEAEEVYTDITKFEKQLKKESPVSSIQSPERCAPTKVLSKKSPRTDLSKSEATDEYIRNIQKRLEEDSFAREQREKRRRKMLMEQLKAHETQEDTYREEQLINRLMRQSQQERRIAVQLMHVRHEKEVLWQNRIFREKQYEERRQKDFQDALDREATLLKQEKLDNEDQMQKEIELYDKLAAERAEARYRKHHDMCKEILDQIIDVVTKVGEYRALTNNLIPVKMMRDWKELFLNGIPLYEQASIELLLSEPSPEELLEQEKMTLLDEKDYEEYKTMTGEWIPPEDAGVQGPAANNNILGYVIRRLQELVSPPKPMTPPPAFPPFPIKGCILGKTFSGKSTSLKFLEKTFSLQVLSVDTLAQEAIQAFHDNELENEDTETEQEENVKQDELSPRAQLGMAAEKLLKSGKSITDELLTEIIVAAIKGIPENTGWILDGFPLTINQAKLFEKAMTGVDPDKAEEKSKKKKSSTTLVTDVRAVKDPPLPIQALDFAILLDIADTVVLQRASGASGDKSSSTTVQQEDINEFSTLELNKKEDHEPVRDQIQHRIAGFLDNWPMLEEWFSEKQNILVKVNGEIEEPVLLNRMEEVILEEIYKKENKGRKKEEQIKEEEKKKEEVPEPAPAPQPETPPPETSQQLEPPAPPAGKKGKKDSKSPNGAKDSSKGKKLKKSESASGKESPKKSGKSDSRGRSPGKKSKSPTPEEAPPPPPPEPTGPPPIQPGSDEWVYVVEPLPQEIPEFLAPYWETVEDTYSKTVKVVLRNLRNEEHTVIYYLHDVRKEYREYLTRPDHKQEFVSQWQADFNSTAEDLWDQEGIRAELHQRVNDLRDRLWDITDNRKEEAEQERSDIINSGWLPDHMGILVNHFFTLMQVEVDRFQDTIRLLRDYYNGMGGDMPTETSRDFVRIALLDLGNSEQPGETEIPKRSPLEGSKSLRKVNVAIFVPEFKPRKTRVPLVDRVPQPAEQTPSKPKIKVPTVKSKDEQVPEKPAMPYESDEKLIIDTWQYAVTAVSNMLAAEVQLKEAEEEKERQLKEMKEKEQQKASKAGSRGSGKGANKNKSKSPNKKKDQTPEPAPQAAPTPEESAELEKKTELQKRIQQEYIAALEFEVAATKSRLDLIKSKVLALEQDLMTKADSAYKDMEKWLGARYLAEMANIDQLVNIACHHIESATKIRLELVLKKTDFYIDGDVKVIPDSPTPSCLPLSEAQLNGTLTISQLNRLYPQFLEVAPGGFIPIKQFVDILLSLITMNLGNEILPEVWMNLTVSDVTALAAAFAVNSDVINWRKFLLSAMQPWPYPSMNDLLVTLVNFKDIDEAGLGTVTQEQYNKVDLWFSTELSLPATEEGTCTPLPFNRLEFIRQFFFTLFADSKKTPPQLDYVKTLFYFACHDDPFEGFYRALSVVTGKPIKMRKRNTFFLKSLPKIEPAFHLLPKYNENRESFDVDLSPDEAQITLANFIEVFQHGVREKGDNYRFYHEQKEQDTFYKLIPHIFEEMGSVDSGPISVSRLLRHPFLQDLMESDQQYKLPDIQGILVKIKQPNEGDHPLDETTSAVETDME